MADLNVTGGDRKRARLYYAHSTHGFDGDRIESLAAEFAKVREECARVAEKFFEPAHTYASENADIYRAQDDACRLIAAAIRQASK